MQMFSKERLTYAQFILHMLIAAIGFISVLLHIPHSLEPSVSITKLTSHNNKGVV